jgi:hypothetical protein
MAREYKRRLSGIAAPVLVREPLLLRLCTGFVNNLTLILRTAFIIGAIFLAQDFRNFTEDLPQSAAGIEPAPAVLEIETEPAPEAGPQEPVLSDRVQHFLNCTFEDYRTTHYDECVEAPSNIYQRPQAD